MKTIAALVVVVAIVALAAVVLASGEGSTQGGLAVGVDADPDGNTATTLGAIDQCVSVAKDDTFSVDVFVTDVTNLMAWEGYFSFDGSIVNVTDLDVELFQAANANSDVFNASEQTLPSGGGLYRLGALDFESPDSGSGVLARLTLEAVGAGISPAILITLDANNDGRPDLGTRLKDPQETPIGDSNGDEFFDGTVFNAQIAVDRDCPPDTPSPSPGPGEASPTAPSGETPGPAGTGTGTPPATSISSPTSQSTSTTRPATPSPTSTATPSSENGGTNWNSPAFVAAYVAAAAVATLAVGGLALLGARRRSGG